MYQSFFKVFFTMTIMVTMTVTKTETATWVIFFVSHRPHKNHRNFILTTNGHKWTRILQVASLLLPLGDFYSHADRADFRRIFWLRLWFRTPWENYKFSSSQPTLSYRVGVCALRMEREWNDSPFCVSPRSLRANKKTPRASVFLRRLSLSPTDLTKATEILF